MAQLLDPRDGEAFSDLPFTFAPANHGCGHRLMDAPWSAAHDLGFVYYYPARFAQAHIRLRHHLIGIEFEPGVARVQMNAGLSINHVVKVCSFYFMPAGSIVEVRKEHACEYLLVTLDPDLCSRLMPQLPRAGFLENVIDPAVTAEARNLRRDILCGEGARGAAPALAAAVVAALSREQVADLIAAPSSPMSPPRLKRALDYIALNFEKKILVDEIAAAVGGISSFHFAHVFRASLGQSPHQCILEHKLHQARSLLTETDQPIADIAYLVGFSSQAHMTDSFSRRIGATPSQIRRSAPSLLRAGRCPPPFVSRARQVA